MAAAALGEWCQATVYHGVKDLYESKKLITKLIWTVVLSTGCFFAITQSVEQILGFVFDDKWATTISTEAPPQGLDWPNVTICGTSLLDAGKLAELGLRDHREIAALPVAGEDGIKFYNAFFSDDQNNQTINRINESMREAIMSEMAFTCDNTILGCGHSHGFRFSVACNCSKITLPDTRKSNDCFKINLGNIYGHLHFGTAGYDSGVVLLLNPRTNRFYENLLYDERASAGVTFRIYFGNDDSNSVCTPILIAPGTNAIIAMTPERHRTGVRTRRTLSFFRPEEPCSKNYQYKWVVSNTISRSLCQWDCYAGLLMEYCGCVFEMKSLIWRENATVCTLENDRLCWNKVKDADLESIPLATFNFTRCRIDCKDACEFDRIATQISTNQFPAANKVKSFTKYINRARPLTNLTDDDTKQLITVQFFYETCVYRLVSTVNRASLDELISNIGGTLGVWTGLSIIGIFQAALYLLYCAEKFIQQGCNRLSNRVLHTDAKHVI